MFKHILVPMDGSLLAECVAPHLITVARAFNARATLLKVLPSGENSAQIDPLTWHIRKTEAQTYLDNWVGKFQALGVSTAAEVLEGHPAERVIEFAASNDVDLLLLSSHGQSGLSGWNLSSVAQKIIMRAHRSVMIIPAYQDAQVDLDGLRYRRLLVPLDCSARAECVLPAAMVLTIPQVSQIDLIHVVRRPVISCADSLGPQDQILIEKIVDREREESKKYLDHLIARYRVNFKPRLLIGESIMLELHEFTLHEGIDLIMLSAHGSSGHSRWPYGSLVLSCIAYSTVPLLIVQDLPLYGVQLSPAEIAAQIYKGH